MITSHDIKMLEQTSGITAAALMENAGKAVAKALEESMDLQDKKILIVAYHGNNGGDGFVAARHLCDIAEVDILFIGDERRLRQEALMNYKKIENNEKLQVLELDDVDFSDYDIIIDAILGTGVQGEIKDPLATVINHLSKSKAYKVSIDIPSGINPDTGEKSNVFFEPDLIIALHDIKKGLESYKDKTIVVDIGLKDNSSA
jgi:hydroxyethylthiazole kinase-like uncharacterized protein yjeF